MFDFDEEIDRRGDGSKKWNTFPPDVLPMFIADMDFRAPPALLDAVRRKLDFGVFGYQYYRDLIRVLAAAMKKLFGAEAKPEWILLIPSLEPALSAVSAMQQGPILLSVPNYFHIVSAPASVGRDSIWSPLKKTLKPDNTEYYEMDFADLDAKAKKADTFILCNPHNPVGRVFTREELLELSRVAKANNLLVLSDEAHNELVFEGRHIPYWTVDDYAFENSITIMSPGKCCNLAALPVAFAIVPNEKLREKLRASFFDCIVPGILHAAAARAAFDGSCDTWKEELLAYLKSNRDLLEAGLRGISKDIRFPHNEATYLQWVDFTPALRAKYQPELEKGVLPFRLLLEKAKIAPSEGLFFGGNQDNYVRINFGTTKARIKTALERISNLF